MLKSDHQIRVEEFMRLAKQDLPAMPAELTEAVRLLRAKLIYEECRETIAALGVLLAHDSAGFPVFDVVGEFNMVELIDGCCDLSVVSVGTLSACGLPDEYFQEAIDENNLAKFSEGYSFREDGKLIKPPGHKPPDIAGMLQALPQKWEAVLDDTPRH